MATTPQAAAFDPDRIDRLVERGLAGELSDAERGELDAAVRESDRARAAFWESVGLDVGLRRLQEGRFASEILAADDLFHGGAVDGAVVGAAGGAAGPTVARSPAARSPMDSWRGAAALVLAASLLVALFAVWRAPVGDALAEASVIGTLRPLSDDGHWSFGDLGGTQRLQFRTGDTLWMDDGAAELTLCNGVVAQLEAPLVLKLLSVEHAQVLRGRVTIDVPKEVEGFRVVTAAAEVIDLGTTFSVDVGESGGTDVVVFQGKVDVMPAAGAEPTEDGEMQRLLTGEALRVADDGTLSRIVNVRRSDFSGPKPEPIIGEVRDNIVRNETRKYYEIVTAGMSEDAPAFVDRRHQWNATTPAGLPGYLVGGDYVKTFNDDKVTDRLEITVSMARPGNLYLLVDDRLERTAWLEDLFEDTGDNVGVDEAPRLERDARTLGVGPGRSVDETHSVWKLRVPARETVRIGPMGTVVTGKDDRGVKSKINMFGIVAVALPPETASADVAR